MNGDADEVERSDKGGMMIVKRLFVRCEPAANGSRHVVIADETSEEKVVDLVADSVRQRQR